MPHLKANSSHAKRCVASLWHPTALITGPSQQAGVALRRPVATVSAPVATPPCPTRRHIALEVEYHDTNFPDLGQEELFGVCRGSRTNKAGKVSMRSLRSLCCTILAPPSLAVWTTRDGFTPRFQYPGCVEALIARPLNLKSTSPAYLGVSSGR
jgi:hypothetical protein